MKALIAFVNNMASKKLRQLEKPIWRVEVLNWVSRKLAKGFIITQSELQNLQWDYFALSPNRSFKTVHLSKWKSGFILEKLCHVLWENSNLNSLWSEALLTRPVGFVQSVETIKYWYQKKRLLCFNNTPIRFHTWNTRFEWKELERSTFIT